MKNYKIISMHDLQLFADGGAAGGTAAGTGAGGTGVDAPAAGVQAVKSNQSTGNPASESAPVAEVQNPTEQPTAVDLNAEFDALIKGKYKDQYNARVKDTIQKRLKGPNEVAEKYKALTPAMELLARRYGIQDVSDAKAIGQAILNDDALIEDAALEAGMETSAFRRLVKAESENAAHRRQQEEMERQQKGRQQYEAWTQQAETAKLVYPGLDLAAEIQNPKFVDLLRSNIDVRTAYEVIHKDDIISGAMQAAVRTATDKVSKSVAANAARPSENGSGQGAATVKPDVSKMTNKDIDEFMRRVARGDRVSFG